LNPATGAHYAAWVYPENSVGGGPSLKLIQFEGWPEMERRADAIGESSRSGTKKAHLVAMTFSGANISISFDGAQMINGNRQ